MPDGKEAERTYDAVLEIDEEYEPKVTAAEAEALKLSRRSSCKATWRTGTKCR